MAVKTFSAGEQLTASDTNTYLANAGLVSVKPVSVTNGSVVANANAVTVTAGSSSVTLNGVFTSTFDAYRIVIANIVPSDTSYGTNLFAKLHDGTNPSNASYNYGIPRVDIAAGTVSASYAKAGTSGVWITNSNGNRMAAAFDIIAPLQVAYTSFVGITTNGPGTGYIGIGAGNHESAAAYSGIQIIVSTGTMSSGSISVYGYRY